MSKRVHRFLPFYTHLVSPKKAFCPHALAWPYPSDSYEATLVVQTTTTHASQLRVPTLPAHLLSSSARSPLYLSFSLTRFNPHFGFLEYIFWLNQLLVVCFTIVVSSYSNSYELVTVIAVIIC
ncbi:unnamed protein product [Hymenolepis diminuta]|uniref:Uncharacterized protein n=1 Tax=Hymenolepis diminuta TaxID=6216 RepID=A0A564Y524_HYMDI|nr:unnamed protein product [Hymenolepis diminuta]